MLKAAVLGTLLKECKNFVETMLREAHDPNGLFSVLGMEERRAQQLLEQLVDSEALATEQIAHGRRGAATLGEKVTLTQRMEELGQVLRRFCCGGPAAATVQHGDDTARVGEDAVRVDEGYVALQQRQQARLTAAGVAEEELPSTSSQRTASQ